jgi:hypothetical protein
MTFGLLRQKTAWGLFDKDGIKDEVGTINLLTPDVVQNAVKEVRTGKSVSLNWGLEKIHQPGFGRTKLQHKIVNWREKEGFSFYSYDDEITLNTQAGILLMQPSCKKELTRSRKPVGWTSYAVHVPF